MIRIRIATAVLAAVALVGSGCGGSKPARRARHITTAAASSTAPKQELSQQAASLGQTAPLTHEQLIARVDAICANLNAKLSSTRITGLKDYAAKLPSLAVYEQTAATQLEGLTPPDSLKHAWARIVYSIRAVGVDMEKLAKYADARNIARFRSLIAEASAQSISMKQAASHAGFNDCAH